MYEALRLFCEGCDGIAKCKNHCELIINNNNDCKFVLKIQCYYCTFITYFLLFIADTIKLSLRLGTHKPASWL